MWLSAEQHHTISVPHWRVLRFSMLKEIWDLGHSFALLGRRYSFSAPVQHSEKGSRNYSLQPIISSRAKVVGTESGRGELSDEVCEIVDAPVNLKSGGCVLVSPVWRSEKGEKVTDRRMSPYWSPAVKNTPCRRKMDSKMIRPQTTTKYADNTCKTFTHLRR